VNPCFEKNLIEKRCKFERTPFHAFFTWEWLNKFLFEIVQVITTLYGAIGNKLNNHWKFGGNMMEPYGTHWEHEILKKSHQFPPQALQEKKNYASSLVFFFFFWFSSRQI
jgi:hypothetical protein